MTFHFPSFIRNMIHVGAGTPALLWLGGMFGISPPMVNSAVGAISTLVTIGATIWSQIHAGKVSP